MHPKYLSLLFFVILLLFSISAITVIAESSLVLPENVNIIDSNAFDGPDKVISTVVPDPYTYNWAVQHDNVVSNLFNWSDKISIPSSSQIQSYNTTTKGKGFDYRSPYIQFVLDVPAEGYTEYVADFRIDHTPKGTYAAILYWTLSPGSLTDTCVSFEGGETGGYAGFQVDEDGKPVVIMSIWDTLCKDKSGNNITIRPNFIYPDVSKCRGDGTFGHEGTGVGCSYDFDWKAEHLYRALIQIGQAPNGNSTVIFWICDQETKRWYYLFEYEVNRTNTHMTSGIPFLEDFDEGHAGEIRSMIMSNIRARSATTGNWVGIESAYIEQGFDLPGSYNYGTDGSNFWAITTGLPNRGDNPAGQRYYVQTISTDDPFLGNFQ